MREIIYSPSSVSGGGCFSSSVRVLSWVRVMSCSDSLASLWWFVFLRCVYQVSCFFIGGDCLANPVYLRCCSCGGLNPVGSEVKPGGEIICVFCGFLFNAPVEAVEVVVDRKRGRDKKQRQRAVKPENRNMRKPLL